MTRNPPSAAQQFESQSQPPNKGELDQSSYWTYTSSHDHGWILGLWLHTGSDWTKCYMLVLSQHYQYQLQELMLHALQVTKKKIPEIWSDLLETIQVGSDKDWELKIGSMTPNTRLHALSVISHFILYEYRQDLGKQNPREASQRTGESKLPY